MGDDNGCPCGDFCVHPSPPCSTALLIEQLRTRLAAVEAERDAEADVSMRAIMGAQHWRTRAEAAEAERDAEREAFRERINEVKRDGEVLAKDTRRATAEEIAAWLEQLIIPVQKLDRVAQNIRAKWCGKGGK